MPHGQAEAVRGGQGQTGIGQFHLHASQVGTILSGGGGKGRLLDHRAQFVGIQIQGRLHLLDGILDIGELVGLDGVEGGAELAAGNLQLPGLGQVGQLHRLAGGQQVDEFRQQTHRDGQGPFFLHCAVDPDVDGYVQIGANQADAAVFNGNQDVFQNRHGDARRRHAAGDRQALGQVLLQTTDAHGVLRHWCDWPGGKRPVIIRNESKGEQSITIDGRQWSFRTMGGTITVS